jgi:hypothetical protein
MLQVKGAAQIERNEMKSIETLDTELDISDAWDCSNEEDE